MKVKDILEKAKKNKVNSWDSYFNSSERRLMKRNKDSEVLAYKIIEDDERLYWLSFIFKSETRQKYYYFLDSKRVWNVKGKERVISVITNDVEQKQDIPDEVKRDIFTEVL